MVTKPGIHNNSSVKRLKRDVISDHNIFKFYCFMQYKSMWQY